MMGRVEIEDLRGKPRGMRSRADSKVSRSVRGLIFLFDKSPGRVYAFLILEITRDILGMNRKDTTPKRFAAVLIGGIIIGPTYRGLSGV
jgi:hypothetical protein